MYHLEDKIVKQDIKKSKNAGSRRNINVENSLWSPTVQTHVLHCQATDLRRTFRMNGQTRRRAKSCQKNKLPNYGQEGMQRLATGQGVQSETRKKLNIPNFRVIDPANNRFAMEITVYPRSRPATKATLHTSCTRAAQDSEANSGTTEGHHNFWETTNVGSRIPPRIQVGM